MGVDQNDQSLEGYERLEQVAARLKSGEIIQPVTIRTLLQWFGAQRRSIPTNRAVRDALFKNNLRITPDLHEAYLDDDIEFYEGNVERKREEAFVHRSMPSIRPTPRPWRLGPQYSSPAERQHADREKPAQHRAELR